MVQYMCDINFNLPFFYIMLPTFNRPDLVIRAISSIVRQNYKNYKLIVFNDGSVKNYIEVEEMVIGDKRIEYIKSENLGVNKSRNIMIESFLKRGNIDNSYFFTLSDDDYLVDNALEIISNTIVNNKKVWYCFNCKSNSKDLFDNRDYLDYKEIKYSQFVKDYHGDKHFIFKLSEFKKIKYPEKFFKNGFEHIFYYQIPHMIQVVPHTVKIIQYYEDGLSVSDLYDKTNTLNIMLKELKSAPLQLVFYKNIFIYLLHPKNIIKEVISEHYYYKLKGLLGLKGRKRKY